MGIKKKFKWIFTSVLSLFLQPLFIVNLEKWMSKHGYDNILTRLTENQKVISYLSHLWDKMINYLEYITNTSWFMPCLWISLGGTIFAWGNELINKIVPARWINKNQYRLNIKNEVSIISTNIIAFLSQVKANAPLTSTSDYNYKTICRFNEIFSPRIIAARNKLAEIGIKDAILDKYYLNIAETKHIILIKERLDKIVEII